jgi:predicted tellurium resistance membrane protein TerC
MVLLVLGLAISIPLVVFGSTLMIRLMERFHFIVVLGAALIGWVAGETIMGDAAWQAAGSVYAWMHYLAGFAGAFLVVLVGKSLQQRGRHNIA